MAMLAELVDGVIGVDTHRDTLTAAAVSNLDGVLAQITTSADAAGYRQLFDFAQTQLPGRRCWAVEGAGSFGVGLTVMLQQHGERVVEVGRPKRPASRSGAKSDALDAVRAAREALSHDRPAIPRRRGEREALRALLTTRRSATTARVAAIGQLKALIVGAPEELRAELRSQPTVATAVSGATDRMAAVVLGGRDAGEPRRVSRMALPTRTLPQLWVSATTGSDRLAGVRWCWWMGEGTRLPGPRAAVLGIALQAQASSRSHIRAVAAYCSTTPPTVPGDSY